MTPPDYTPHMKPTEAARLTELGQIISSSSAARSLASAERRRIWDRVRKRYRDAMKELVEGPDYGRDE